MIELHNHVLRSADRAAAELIANNALQAGIVVPGVDAALPPGDDLTLRIVLNGNTSAEVTHSGWQDAVVQALADLSGLLAPHGLSLRAGNCVLTGSRARLFPILAETRVEVSTLNHGCVTAMFRT